MHTKMPDVSAAMPVTFQSSMGQRFANLTPDQLIDHALQNGEGKLVDTGALMVDTGEFTGRSPEDRFIVKDDKTVETVWWGSVNIPFSPERFDALHQKMLNFLADKTVYTRYAFAGANPDYRLNIEVINTLAWHNLFSYSMFLRPSADELAHFKPDFTIICIPEFKANPATDGTRSGNFAILNMTRNILLIGGTGYAGEIKKGIFSVLNFKLPVDYSTLSMHASANQSNDESDTALFFGLSGTGKTTLSADPGRKLIGDDEHGWSDSGVFNFEGGCYAKVVNLTAEKEPQIFGAIRRGAVLENTRLTPGTQTVDYTNISVTQNTRVSYPIHFINTAKEPSVGGHPKNIFFLTADSFGILPPISQLTPGQAMYHFISGYTAKVAGTEMGVKEPKATFSACFGQAFLPLHPTRYAEILGQRMREFESTVWLINTGWTGGAYGTGHRMNLDYTRAMITAALNGELANVAYENHPVFGMAVPQTCPNVPADVLNPRETWSDSVAYDEGALHLAQLFRDNFNQFAEFANDEIQAGGPN